MPRWYQLWQCWLLYWCPGWWINCHENTFSLSFNTAASISLCHNTIIRKISAVASRGDSSSNSHILRPTCVAVFLGGTVSSVSEEFVFKLMLAHNSLYVLVGEICIFRRCRRKECSKLRNASIVVAVFLFDTNCERLSFSGSTMFHSGLFDTRPSARACDRYLYQLNTG